jgi:hypothetical protein
MKVSIKNRRWMDRIMAVIPFHRSNNYEVCTAVALCFLNILDVMVLENINLSSDRNRATVTVV